ncbi:superoxide dismutase, partial [Candidatus Woesearchaeota archaeon]|nr:superoxide dismutase [Candidatus Woesearchaeota archaeon]
MKYMETLPYPYNALEPYIDEETMRVHHDKHYQAYFDKYTKAVEGTEWAGDVKTVLENIDKLPEKIKQAVVNNGGGYYHHKFFWTILKKDVPFSGKIKDAIEKKWGSFDKFKEEFSGNAKTLFGSGWTWLVLNNGGLEIVNTKNQDSPVSLGMVPLLCIDVWEHAY